MSMTEEELALLQQAWPLGSQWQGPDREPYEVIGWADLQPVFSSRLGFHFVSGRLLASLVPVPDVPVPPPPSPITVPTTIHHFDDRSNNWSTEGPFGSTITPITIHPPLEGDVDDDGPFMRARWTGSGS